MQFLCFAALLRPISYYEKAQRSTLEKFDKTSVSMIHAAFICTYKHSILLYINVLDILDLFTIESFISSR